MVDGASVPGRKKSRLRGWRDNFEQFENSRRGKVAIGTLTAADSDAVARQLQERGAVPLRSWFGNAVSAGLFRAVAGARLGDTQTGLRGIPASLLD